MMRLALLVLPFALAPTLAQTPPHKLFDAPVLSSVAEEMELLADVDLDGDIDVIGFAYVGTSVLKTSFRPLLNNGGTFIPGTSVAIPADAGYHVHCADVDGNGFPDVLVATSTSHVAGAGLLVYRGLGGGAFAAPIHVPLPGNVMALANGNANGDGVADLLVIHFSGVTTMQARWLLGGPALTFPSGPTSPVPYLYVGAVVVFDLDGDGVSDFAALRAAGVGMEVAFFRTTPGGFVVQGTVPAASSFADVMVGTDVEGDGDLDLVVASVSASSTANLVTMRNQGAAGFTATSQALTGLTIYVLAAGDWDGDGDADLVARGGSSGSSNAFFQVTLFENSGGSFVAQRVDTLPGDPVGPGAGCADLDGDGALDYVGARAVLFGTGRTTLDPRPYTVFTDDWDGDGDLDHVIRPELRVNDGRSGFTVLPGFWPPSPGANQFYLDPIATGDFDGDGLRELLVPLVFQVFPSSQQFLAVRRLEADGDGRLHDVGAAAAPAAEIQAPCVVDDADGDGDLDVVTGQGVWQNNGAGFFSLLPQAFQNFQPCAKGDVDGDGDQDLLAASSLPSLAILYRTAPATYTLTVLPAPSSSTLSMPALFADLDDDGDLDAIAKERVSFGVFRTAIFVNSGGVFTAGPTLPQTGFGLAAADFDGDGLTDLAVQDIDRLHLVRRVGPGLVYAAPLAFALRGGMTSAADLDQDGDVDLLGNPTTWNRRFVMPGAGQRRQYGLGSAGTGGRRPLLSMIGPLRAGHVPSARLVSGLGGSFAVLFASTTEANVPNLLPGVTAYIGPWIVTLGGALGGVPGQPGAGGFDLPIPIPPGAFGTQLFLQCLVLDPAAPIGLTHSNGCELLVGQ